MTPSEMVREIDNLPPEAQQEVRDFIAFLKTRYPITKAIKKARKTKLTDEPFFGMWKDREDMKDSTAWVRKIHKEQWERRS